jgi:D-alanyl-D-alanine carboxypeptidase
VTLTISQTGAEARQVASNLPLDRSRQQHVKRLPGLLLVLALACGCSSIDGDEVPDRPDTAGAAAPVSPPVTAARAPHRSAAEVPAFDPTAHSTTDPASIWVVVNKTNPITPSDFRPEISLVRGYQVADAATGPLARLLDDADREGLGFKIASAFRSYDYQRSVYAGVVASRGVAAADRVSARPGFSEHQTGLAVDLVTPLDPSCDFDACFARTPGGRWLAEHAWRYGFLVRYTVGNEAITGYDAEPWHLRYVGKALAREMRETGVATLEELFDVPGGDYR